MEVIAVDCYLLDHRSWSVGNPPEVVAGYYAIWLSLISGVGRSVPAILSGFSFTKDWSFRIHKVQGAGLFFDDFPMSILEHLEVVSFWMITSGANWYQGHSVPIRQVEKVGPAIHINMDKYIKVIGIQYTWCYLALGNLPSSCQRRNCESSISWYRMSSDSIVWAQCCRPSKSICQRCHSSRIGIFEHCWPRPRSGTICPRRQSRPRMFRCSYCSARQRIEGGHLCLPKVSSQLTCKHFYQGPGFGLSWESRLLLVDMFASLNNGAWGELVSRRWYIDLFLNRLHHDAVFLGISKDPELAETCLRASLSA